MGVRKMILDTSVKNARWKANYQKMKQIIYLEDFVSKFDVEFEMIIPGFYRLLTNEYTFNPRCFKMLTDYQGYSYNRLFWNVWVLR